MYHFSRLLFFCHLGFTSLFSSPLFYRPLLLLRSPYSVCSTLLPLFPSLWFLSPYYHLHSLFLIFIYHSSFSLRPPHNMLTRLSCAAAVRDDILTWHLPRNSNPNTTSSSPMVITGNIVFYCLRINKLVHRGGHKLTVLRVFFLNERPPKQPGIFLGLCHGPLNWDPSQ